MSDKNSRQDRPSIPTRSLPVRPNLDQLKHQAKDLLRDIQRGDPAAIEEFNAFHPRPIVLNEGGRLSAQEERRPRPGAGEPPAVPVRAGQVAGMAVNIK